MGRRKSRGREGRLRGEEGGRGGIRVEKERMRGEGGVGRVHYALHCTHVH